MGAAPFFLTLIELLGKAAPAVVEKLFDMMMDPSLNEALSPSAGLSVTPLTFNSIDPEGHWKSNDWGYNKERAFTSRLIADKDGKLNSDDNTGSSIASPGEALVTRRTRSGVGAVNASPTQNAWRPLLTIQIPKPPAEYDYIAEALSLVTSSSSPAIYKLAQMTILQNAYAHIAATWEYDDLEIWGGYAGLDSAYGFMSLFGHRATVEISGTPYGNYLPGAYMITMTGHVNPVGPAFYEFRCAAVVQAGRTGPQQVQPLWGAQWDRDTGQPKDIDFDEMDGFKLDIKPY